MVVVEMLLLMVDEIHSKKLNMVSKLYLACLKDVQSQMIVACLAKHYL